MTLSDYFALKSGNQASLVRILGVPQATVAQWASRNRSVPAEYCIEIEHATGGAVTRKELLPDTWASIWPELSYGSSIDEPLRARMIELAGEVAAAREQAAKDATDRKRHIDEVRDMVQMLDNAASRNRELENQLLALFGPAAEPVDHGAKVRAAITDARFVFGGQKVAKDVLHYLEQVLAAGAPVPAQTGIEPVRLSLFDASKDLLQWIETAHRPPKHDNFGIMALVRVDALATLADAVADEELRRAAPVTAGGGNASIVEEGLAAVGAEPAACADPFRVAARQAVMHQARADLAQAVDAPVRPTAAQQADISRHQAAIDRAAAAMAAQSAQKLADAERSVAARAGARVALDPLEALSREVFSLSYELRQPAHLAVQLLILWEMRQQRYGVSRSR